VSCNRGFLMNLPNVMLVELSNEVLRVSRRVAMRGTVNMCRFYLAMFQVEVGPQEGASEHMVLPTGRGRFWVEDLNVGLLVYWWMRWEVYRWEVVGTRGWAVIENKG